MQATYSFEEGCLLASPTSYTPFGPRYSIPTTESEMRLSRWWVCSEAVLYLYFADRGKHLRRPAQSSVQYTISI